MIRYALILGLLLSFCGGVDAQDRLPPIPADKMTDAQKKSRHVTGRSSTFGLTGHYTTISMVLNTARTADATPARTPFRW